MSQTRKYTEVLGDLVTFSWVH